MNFLETDIQTRLQHCAQSARNEVATGVYPHADRSLSMYRRMIPGLDTFVQSLLRLKSPLSCLDAGCGTSQAVSQLEAAYQNALIAYGVNLVAYPPTTTHVLPPERLIISSIGGAPFAEKQFNLILAVGSIDTSMTITQEGTRLLQLLADPGVFIFAPTTFFSGDEPQCQQLIDTATSMRIHNFSMLSEFNMPVYYFSNITQ